MSVLQIPNNDAKFASNLTLLPKKAQRVVLEHMEGIAPTIDVPPEEADSLKAAIREAIDYAVANFEPHRLNQSGPSTRQLAELMHVYAETLSNRTRRRAIYSTVGHLGAVAGYGYASIKIL